MKLYLVRHAIAEERSAPADTGRASAAKGRPKASAVSNDAERALTAQGKAKMARTAQGLRKAKVRPELILTSPLRRARETAEIVAGELAGTKIEALDELAPGAEPSAVVAALRRYHSLRAIALVGHQPDLGYLASFLLAGSPNACNLNFKKGSVACLEGDLADDATSCSLLWLMPPKLLRSL
ncbi:MAG TPA: phosphohistidine phosphatase SixA [Candidatus Binataceae bacterium]|nr:phosphohistidine phosphatase SixA [Candidatus Binataceae bacterium]